MLVHYIMEDKAIKNLMILAKIYANMMSDDPDTRVGAIFINKDLQILSIGCNHSPYSMKLNATSDSNKNKFVRPVKYDWIEHAERNAIYNALNNGVSLQGSICITTLVPCKECTKAIISSGISKVYTFKPNSLNSRWMDDFNKVSKLLFDKANIPYEFIDITSHDTLINPNQYGWTPDNLYKYVGGHKKLRNNKTKKQHKYSV